MGSVELIPNEDPSLSAHGYQLLPQQPVSRRVIIGNLMYKTYFEVFYSLCVEVSL